MDNIIGIIIGLILLGILIYNIRYVVIAIFIIGGLMFIFSGFGLVFLIMGIGEPIIEGYPFLSGLICWIASAILPALMLFVKPIQEYIDY